MINNEFSKDLTDENGFKDSVSPMKHRREKQFVNIAVASQNSSNRKRTSDVAF